MSDYLPMRHGFIRESATEEKIRAMDVSDIVELVHGLEDEIERHEMASDMLREALDAIAESEWDASAGLLRDIANKALATAPEGGEV